MKIQSVEAIEILDSRGNPTVEVDLELEDGTIARAMAILLVNYHFKFQDPRTKSDSYRIQELDLF